MKKIVIPLAIVGIVVIITVGAGLKLSAHKAPTTQITAQIPAASTSPSPIASVSASSTPAASRYKNGSYSATGTYTSPGGQEQVTVTLSVQSDTITAVNVVAGNNDRQSQEYVAMFAGGIHQVVVGKPLAGAFDVSEVNGSSLTGIGFSQALQTIRSQAAS